MDRDHWRRGRCHRLWQEQGGRCFHCDQPMPDPLSQRLRHRKRPDSATIEHVVPQSGGGVTDWSNEVAACRRCNAAKADRPATAEELARLEILKR
jgi:5-methylcytosine-specific restriction endonuclease McrA